MAVPVLELRSVRGTGGGPEKTILAGAIAADSAKSRVTVCYIRDARDDVFHINRRAATLGVDYVELVERHSFDPSVWRGLRQIAAARKSRIVHSHDYKTDLLALLLAKRTGIVPVATAHGWTGHTLRERLLYYPAHKRLLGRFPLVLAVSSQIRDELIARGAAPERVRVLLNGIDPTLFRRDRSAERAARLRFGVPDSVTVVGAVGRLEPQKRFDLLIEAFVEARREISGLHLLIAGDGSERPALEARISQHGLSEACRLLGHQSDVIALHHAFDAFVQSSDYEGTPNAVLEAMALETPVVATDAGGTREICRDGVEGTIVPRNDRPALASAIVQTMTDVEGRTLRVRRARDRVEHELSFANRVKALDDLYSTLAETPTCANG